LRDKIQTYYVIHDHQRTNKAGYYTYKDQWYSIGEITSPILMNSFTHKYKECRFVSNMSYPHVRFSASDYKKIRPEISSILLQA
jgi:hypothetical protein